MNTREQCMQAGYHVNYSPALAGRMVMFPEQRCPVSLAQHALPTWGR